MSIPKNIENNNLKVYSPEENDALIDQKLDELVALVYNSDAGLEDAGLLKTMLNNAVNNAKGATGNDDKNEFSILLSSPQSNSRMIRKYLQGESISKTVLIVLSLIMIILGLGMIIMPAPPFFEMFTIFYFNRDDGITIMDLISLIIILAGVYFLIKGIYKNPALKKLLEKNNHL